MSYTLRNTIALGVILAIIFGFGGYFALIRYPNRLHAVEESIKKIDIELQNTPVLLNQVNMLTAQVETTKRQWATRVKDIPPGDITSDTYDYLIRTIDASGAIRMNMLYNGVKNLGNYGFGTYDLQGTAPFGDFYRFLWYVENGRRLYKVRTLELKQVWTKEQESAGPILLVNYHMIVESYFSPIPELSSATGERALRPGYLAVNPFYPAILPEIPPNTRDLVEIKRSILKGVIAGKAYVQDQSNRIRELGEGDEIYLGYISKVDPEKGMIEYILNEGGIIDKGQLTIRTGEIVK